MLSTNKYVKGLVEWSKIDAKYGQNMFKMPVFWLAISISPEEELWGFSLRPGNRETTRMLIRTFSWLFLSCLGGLPLVVREQRGGPCLFFQVGVDSRIWLRSCMWEMLETRGHCFSQFSTLVPYTVVSLLPYSLKNKLHISWSKKVSETTVYVKGCEQSLGSMMTSDDKTLGWFGFLQSIRKHLVFIPCLMEGFLICKASRQASSFSFWWSSYKSLAHPRKEICKERK